MSIETITLGCRLNFAETETIARSAPADEDWIVINSCAVTNEAVRQTGQAIRRAHRHRPNAKILVTGCAAELQPDRFANMPGVSRVVGNAAKLTAFMPPRHPGLDPGPAFSLPTSKRRQTPARREAAVHPERRRQVASKGRGDEQGDVMAPAGLLANVKSFVAIQTGCDHRCTFCSIWQARGPSVSLPFGAIRNAVVREIDRGAKEIVLTGVDITDYACPERSRREGGLGLLCQRLLAAEPRLTRLRLSSLDSIEIDDALFELIAGEPRLMPHFHLSLQAGDDMILKRMKRRHSRADAVRTVERIKAARPGASIGADLIAGFPTETEEMSLNSLKLLDDCNIVAAHIFPFSPRPTTPAARMPQLARELVKARAARLRDAAARRRGHWLDSMIGSIQPLLVEGEGVGHTDNFAPISIAGATRGETGYARITGRDNDRLTASWA